MIANNAQLVGRRKYENEKDPSRNSTTLYFAYADDRTEGSATVNFTVFTNNRNINPDTLVVKGRYNLFFYRNARGFMQLDSIQPV